MINIHKIEMKVQNRKIVENKRIFCELIYYVILILFCGTVGIISLGKGVNFNISYSFSGDGTLIQTFIKSIQENGMLGAWFCKRIGAPENASLIDFPAFGNTMIFMLWFISRWVKSTAKIMYIYLIWTFIVDGVGMSLLLRKLNVNKYYSFTFSSLFAFAPYHFYRYLVHETLIDYISVPITIYLCLIVIGILENEKKWKIVISAILLGVGYGYYYAFGLVLLAVSFMIRIIKEKRIKSIIKNLYIMGIVLITVFVSLLPKIIYSCIYGKNLEAGRRVFYEQEIYGLKIITLFLPVSYSKIGKIGSLTQLYNTSGAPLINENTSASLGIIGSLGFLLLCICLVISFIRKDKKWPIFDFLSLSTLVLVLMSTIGGFGEIFNVLITSQIRCYNRCSIFILGLSLTALAIAMGKIKIKRQGVVAAISVFILGVGCLDQVNIYADNWQRGDIQQTQSMYESYFSKVENSLGNNTMVYQLPYMDFPEAGSINNLTDYKHFVGYLYTDHLKWSYGAVRGRNLKAKELNVGDGMTYEFLAGIKGAGFQAVYIDVDGYSDGGTEILRFYNSLGIEPIVSPDNKLYVYDISNLKIEESWKQPGISFVKKWEDICGKFYDEKTRLDLAKGIEKKDVTIYDKLYEDADLEKMQNEKYIDWLYENILGRKESDEERTNWLEVLKEEKSSKVIFYDFLNSDEFRNNEKLN